MMFAGMNHRAALYGAHDDGCGCGCLNFKADPYGVIVPSRLPNPLRGSGEPVPAPGLPAEYPHYLKPIPVNTRSIRGILEEYLRRNEPALIRILYSTINASLAPVKYQEIRNALATGELSHRMLRDFQEEYSRAIVNHIGPAFEAAAQAAHGPLAAGVYRATGYQIPFERTALYMSDWIRSHGAELAVNLSASQYDALRVLVHQFAVVDPINPREAARYIRPVAGLTPKQTQAVVNYRAGLVAAGIKGDKLVNQVENYAAWLHRKRAERIARTELAFAFNQASLNTMRDAQDEGVGMVTKTLIAGRGERTCALCGGLNGVTIALDETFPGGTTRLPNVYAPPLHPNCRCALTYEIEV